MSPCWSGNMGGRDSCRAGASAARGSPFRVQQTGSSICCARNKRNKSKRTLHFERWREGKGLGWNAFHPESMCQGGSGLSGVVVCVRRGASCNRRYAARRCASSGPGRAPHPRPSPQTSAIYPQTTWHNITSETGDVLPGPPVDFAAACAGGAPPEAAELLPHRLWERARHLPRRFAPPPRINLRIFNYRG